VEAHDLDRLRRSIATLQGSSAGPLTKEAALTLVDEVMSSRRQTARYRQAIAQLHRVLDALDQEAPG
jgi:hypothetical protein